MDPTNAADPEAAAEAAAHAIVDPANIDDPAAAAEEAAAIAVGAIGTVGEDPDVLGTV